MSKAKKDDEQLVKIKVSDLQLLHRATHELDYICRLLPFVPISKDSLTLHGLTEHLKRMYLMQHKVLPPQKPSQEKEDRKGVIKELRDERLASKVTADYFLGKLYDS